MHWAPREEYEKANFVWSALNPPRTLRRVCRVGMRLAPPPTPPCRARTPWSAALLHAAAVLAAAGISAGAANAADISVLGIPGSWQLRETRAGNLCEARVTFTADAPGALEGNVRLDSPCTDPGRGVWRVVFDGSGAASKLPQLLRLLERHQSASAASALRAVGMRAPHRSAGATLWLRGRAALCQRPWQGPGHSSPSPGPDPQP